MRSEAVRNWVIAIYAAALLVILFVGVGGIIQNLAVIGDSHNAHMDALIHELRETNNKLDELSHAINPTEYPVISNGTFSRIERRKPEEKPDNK